MANMFLYCPNCGTKNNQNQGYFFRCEKCGLHFYENSSPTVGIIPVYQSGVLLSIRGVEPDKGTLDTIGGFLESGEHPLDGAVREFEEETGVVINPKDLEFFDITCSDYFFEGRNRKILNIIYLLKLDKILEVNPKDDVEELIWIQKGDNLSSYKLSNYMEPVIKLLQKANIV